jgi:Fe/S biogenesis protein NfuA
MPAGSLAAMSETTHERPILDVTERARSEVLALRAAEDDADQLALRIEITGSSGTDYVYDLTFERRDTAAADDAVYEVADLPVLIPAASIERLRGSTLDRPVDGLVLRNPNKANPYGDTESLELTGTVEERIEQLLDRQVNPSLAAHGGFVQLVRVEGPIAYMLMGGGCQGCGLAAATLTAGVEAALVDAIPEITRVEDVTDHAAGENPFYAPSK